MIHELKVLPMYYKEILSGRKTFEIRKNDRAYKVGDLLALNEYDPENGYTEKCCLVYIDYIICDESYCKDGYIIMSIKPCLVGFSGSPRNMNTMCENYCVPEVENNAERRYQ